MNDPLLQLREDVVRVLGVSATAPVGRPVLAVIDEFRAEYEAVEARVDPYGGDCYEVNSARPDSWERITIIVPRAKEQTLVEAAKAYQSWTTTHGTINSDDCETFNRLHADLAAALKKEEG